MVSGAEGEHSVSELLVADVVLTGLGCYTGLILFKKNLSIQLYSATLDMTGLIHIFGIKFLCYD